MKSKWFVLLLITILLVACGGEGDAESETVQNSEAVAEAEDSAQGG